jgi:hypothetical protein
MGSPCAASDSGVVQRVKRDGERDQQPTVNALHAGADLEHVAVAQLAEHAPVAGCLLAVEDEVEWQPRQQPEPVRPRVLEAAQQRDEPARLVGLAKRVAARIDGVRGGHPARARGARTDGRGRSNSATAEALVVTERISEKHVTGILSKLNLSPAVEGYPRVFGVLAFLGSA